MSDRNGNNGHVKILEKNERLKNLVEREPSWITQARDRAAERFGAMEWPKTSEEEWRRSDVSALELDRYLERGDGTEKSAGNGAAAERTGQREKKWRSLPGRWSGKIGFSAGKAVYSDLNAALRQKGVVFMPYSEEVKDHDFEILRKTEHLFSKGVERIDNRISALHYSAWDHGVVIYVPPFVELTHPLFIDFAEEGKKTHTAPHVLVYLDKGARATVIQRIRSRERDEVLCNAGADVLVEESAGLDFVTLQTLGGKSTFFSHGNATVHRSGAFHSVEAILGGGFSKTRLEVSLSGEGSDAYLRGLYLPDGERHIDMRTVQRHLAPHTSSRSFYKGAVKDAGRSVYQGLIEVGPNAVKTDAFLTNKNLVLNDGARADSIPSLQIKTNDVKCSHGSTTGKIDAEQLFYLMSRGISRHDAERMLVEGYFENVFQETPPEIQKYLRKLVAKRI